MDRYRRNMTSNRFTRFFSFCKTSYGAISREGAVKKIDSYKKRTGQCLGIGEKEDLLKFGHQAGSYEQYPKDPEKTGTDTLDISKLMKQSFDDYSLDGIEIDIQIDQENRVGEGIKDIYVVHDKLENDLKSYAIEYLKRNTLKKVLRDFIEAKYYENNKHIYIEIKCDDSERLDTCDERVIAGTLDVIDGLVKEYSHEDAEEICDHLAFASFNYRALEKIDKLSKHRYDLFFIAASNRTLGWIATKTIYRHFNYLGKMLKKTLSESNIITGVFFDPCAIDDFGAVFNRINDTRENEFKLEPLKIFISTYLLEEDEYFDRIENEGKNLQNVKGLFFDIKSK
ncbi:MAG: hypothetical protein JRI43_05580 [Deltaproteobacteria bacterium]|nr:hypothetical protein [Deltaproteobacteria bacterium]